ncbi:MAG: AtpZ/AtpI family protein [Alphaproteobacteria bacterium]|nr:AtpZ/AtpI family protein [Alphaproteobacteria bacterium]
MPDETDDLPSLEALAHKIEKAKPAAEHTDAGRGDSDYAQAFRFTADLLAGVLTGALVGYGVDVWMGTLPWAMLVCVFLGTAAGIRNMMRSAREIESKRRE